MAYRIASAEMITLDELVTLPRDNSYREEVSDGWLIREPPVGPSHSSVVARIIYLLMQHNERASQKGLVHTDCGFVLEHQPLTVRGPDISYMRNELPRASAFYDGAPDIAIEVRSANDRTGELLKKVAQYLDAGSTYVLVVDPERRSAARYDQTGEPKLLNAQDTVEFPEVLPDFALTLEDFFS